MKRIWQKLNKEKLVVILLVLIQVFVNKSAIYADPEQQVVCMVASGILLLLLSVYALYIQRKNMMWFMAGILVLYFNYSLAASVYFSPDALPKSYKPFVYGELLRGVNIVLVFLAVFLCVLKKGTGENKRLFTEKFSCDWLVTVGASVYIAAAPFLFYSTESFGTRGIASAFYEYSLIVLIVALAFCGRNLKALFLLLIASGWIIVHGLLHGERILALQMMIALGVYLMLHKISLKLIIPGCLVGIFVFTLVGLSRGLTDLEGDIITQAFEFLKTRGMANDTCYAAFKTSLNVIRFADVTPWPDRMLFFLRYLLYIVAGSAVKDVNLAVLALKVGTHGGGGWLPVYFYFWLGYLGVILSGAALGKLVNKLSEVHVGDKFLSYLALYVVSTLPRWYLYSPAALTRGLLMYILVFTAAALAHRIAGKVYRLCTGMLKKGT